MVEMELSKIIVNDKRQDQVIVLKEKKGERILPIIIGISEAQAIKIKLTGFSPPRPLTHDLLKSTIEELGGDLERVVIDKLEQNTFHAKLVIKINGKLKYVDARPSDSIALAIRAKAPIFVEDEVLKQAEVFNK
jgi:bifunctional DNase/RNase